LIYASFLNNKDLSNDLLSRLIYVVITKIIKCENIIIKKYSRYTYVIEISNLKFKGSKMITDFEKLLPSGILFSIKEINDMGVIKSDMLRKLILNRQIEVVKIGKKNFLSRDVLINYLNSNTVTVDI